MACSCCCRWWSAQTAGQTVPAPAHNAVTVSVIKRLHPYDQSSEVLTRAVQGSLVCILCFSSLVMRARPAEAAAAAAAADERKSEHRE